MRGCLPGQGQGDGGELGLMESHDHADVKIHPPIMTALHLAAAVLLSRLFPFPATTPGWMIWLGILFVLAGLALAFAAVNQFRAAGATLDPHGSVSAIVNAGPYRFSRNPIYLSFALTLIGLPLALGTYWGILLTPVFTLLMNHLVIRHEEAYLEKKFGDVYTGYRSRVRRWL